MIGSTFIYEVDQERLAELQHDIECLDDMTIVELDSLSTLDFELACPSGIRWSDGEPVVYGEGLAVLRISTSALAYILESSGFSDPVQLEDLVKLRNFVSVHGSDHLYEFTTF
jgi:hypothetical protein